MASRGALAAGGRGGGVRAAPRWPATAVVTLAPESALPGTWSRTPTHRRRVWTRSRTVGVGAVRWGKERTAARRAWAVDGVGGGTVGPGWRRARRERAEVLEVLTFLNVVTRIVSP